MASVETLNAQERFLSLEDSKNGTLCKQEATAYETTTGPLESTGDRLVRLLPTSGVTVHKCPIYQSASSPSPPSPETAIIANGIRLLKSMPGLQRVNCSPTRSTSSQTQQAWQREAPHRPAPVLAAANSKPQPVVKVSGSAQVPPQEEGEQSC